MTSVQRFLSGHENKVRTSALTASSVAASTAIERLAASRAGGGRARLVGSYTGHEATEIDVEIVNATGAPRASVPAFAGVGNGALTVASVDPAATLQAYTFTLVNLGVDTESATLTAREVVIRAKNPGAAGNLLRITITPSLTAVATPKALLADWQAGTLHQVGEQWDLGGLPLSAKGEIDPSTPRIRFGSDPTVYRPWREYKDGEWRHGLSPALERTVKAGTRVYTVIGTYAATVTDGTTSEDYTSITTFHNLLTALASSALVEVVGVVAADRTVGGQAAIDVPIRTSAWLFGESGKVRLEDVSVPSAAPTQSITVRCINADKVGAERWSVEGTVSGSLAPAVTGAAYTSAAINLLVPPKKPVTEDSGEWGFKYEPTSRGDSEGLPSVCVRPFRFGVNAKARSVTFRYQLRPPPECQCSDMPTPRLSLQCLGIEGEDDMPIAAEYKSRLEALYEFRRDFHASNVAEHRAAPKDLDYMDAIADVFAEALAEIHESEDARAEWDLALTEMQTFVEWLEGGVGRPGYKSVVLDFGNLNFTVGTYFLNPLNGHYYAVTAATSDSTPIDLIGFSDVPALSNTTFWKTDGSSFSHTESTSVVTFKDCGTTPPDGENLPSATGSEYSVETLARKYRARMDYVRTLAGIVPKFDAGSGAGGCWRDYPDETHWWVDSTGYYLPAFTNKPYISARRNTETGEPYSTQEFGFGLVVACPDRLKVGDTLTIDILVVDGERPYQVGDEAILETVAAGPAWLVGGVDGTDVQTWDVRGSVSGALASYSVPTKSAIPPYTLAGQLSCAIALGGIPFALGDRFSFSVEAGQFRWRRDGGAWSSAANIPASGSVALADGVAAEFLPGAAPSYVAGDIYNFRVQQPNAASHVLHPSPEVWRWSGATATMTINLGASLPVSAIALARYSLPTGATATVEHSTDGVFWSAPIALDVSGPVCVKILPAPITAGYLRVSLAVATGGAIGWIWAGVPLTTAKSATSCERQRRWMRSRGRTPNAAALYSGRGDGWSIGWRDWLTDADADALIEMTDWMAERSEPIIFVPHHLHPEDSALVELGSDALELPDRHDYQTNSADRRMLSATLNLDAVLA